ncbi:MAG TPA: YraN family protein [Jatrophihabitans sp.]|nr:YraN family protein [Jatrophihabitans sp.]
MRVKDAVGRFGEQVAADHLSKAGLEILERNWRCRDGELDIVARDGAALVFVEVKTRSSVSFGLPAAAVDRRKIARLRRLAVRWMNQHRELDRFWSSVRFDVVSVLRRASGGPQVDHLRGV